MKKDLLFFLFFLLISDIHSVERRISKGSTGIVRKTGDDLGTPVCDDDRQCTIGGICREDKTGKKRCMCSSTCYMTVPVSCKIDNPISCMTMGENYVSKYNTSLPFCYENRCVCPPQYDPLPAKSEKAAPGISHMLPMKCDKRDLKVMMAISPRNSVYKGEEATIYCCINLDAREFISRDGVLFVQNGTRSREPTESPYDSFTAKDDTLFTIATCWLLNLLNAQLSDSGNYTCIVQPKNPSYSTVNETINFTVKIPRMIQNLSIIPNATEALITWNSEDESMLKVGIEVYERSAGKRIIWNSENETSPIRLTNLEPATPYTVFITVQDGQIEPARISEQFQSLDGQSDHPQADEIRLANTVDGLQCEVEWRPPLVTNGQILKYYVQLKGQLRYKPEDVTGEEIDFPPGLPPCSNYDGVSENQGVDVKLNFFSCKFRPLKPNRNYTATIWAVNKAGKSIPVTFDQKCSMDYAEPDEIEPPESSPTVNATSFTLKFTNPPKELNGPIACYYLAIVPLPSNASVQKLPRPNEIVMDSFESAMTNNVRSTGDRYFAYIAESYLNFPKETIVGDNKGPSDVEPCNAIYLSRYKARDPPLQTDLKYTGFLVVRVDRDSRLHSSTYERTLIPRRTRNGYVSNEYWTSNQNIKRDKNVIWTHGDVGPRFSRQLAVSDPAYGFSDYFKPVFLEYSTGTTSAYQIFGFLSLSLIALLMLAGFLLYLFYKKGLIRHLCPIKKDHNLLRQAFQPIPVEDLASEYIIRHRDSDFLFTSEFDALPKTNLPCTACDRSENERKNRYHDIKACDETRVKLKKVGSDGSDYINANFIKGYCGKKTFIAAQAPLENTMNDFWKMIWEQDVRIIIMAANMNERGRKQASKYWPNINENNIFVNGDLEICCKKTDVFADYTKREFELIYGNNAEKEALVRSGSFKSQPENDYANVPINRPGSKNSNKTPLLDGDLVNKEIRKIAHYHFTNWVDLKAPESTCGILRLMLKLRKMEEYLEHPVLIHCSAGVGRTGTFIAIDTLIDQCINEGKADVFGTVANIRQQRNSVMVQTMEQYAFIYRALAEYFLFGDTDVRAEEFCDYYARLRYVPRERRISGNNVVRMSSIAVNYDQNGSSTPPQTVSLGSGTTTSSVGAVLNAKLKQWRNGLPLTSKENNGKKSALENEYQLLFTNLDPARSTTIAHREENIKKNRYIEAVPYDKYRIMLTPRIGCSSTSQYINATPHKGYWQSFILAQDPVDLETCHEFWRMVDDGRTRIIVMLSREEDFNYGEKYWPEEPGTPLILGKDNDLTVSLISERIHPTLIERKIQYKFKREEETCEVIQYLFTGWIREAITPASTGPIR